MTIRFTPPHTLFDSILAYENDELDGDEQVALFQRLIDNGLAWSLQGHYGRMAHELIKAGLCEGGESK